MSDHPELDDVVALLKAGKTVPPVTIRTFLGWFNVQRRTRLNVEYVDAALEKAGVRTVPGYFDTWVDNPITFEFASAEDGEGENQKAGHGTDHGDETLDHSVADDPSFKNRQDHHP